MMFSPAFVARLFTLRIEIGQLELDIKRGTYRGAYLTALAQLADRQAEYDSIKAGGLLYFTAVHTPAREPVAA